MADAEKAYMQSPLVLWVETFKANDGHPLEYRDLYDGVFLNDVMQQIDPRPAYESVNRHVEDMSVRLHNWDILVKNVRGFYRDVLQQLLVLRLPNITAICRDPVKESSFAEIRRALLLVLGCAVQCEQKEDFVYRIRAMDIDAQTEIAKNIMEVKNDRETVLSTQRPDSPTSCNTYVDKLFHHLYRLISERDQCAELACDLGQERDYYMSQAEGRPVVDSPQLSSDKHHLALELAECKAKLRHIRQELEDRQEQLSDMTDELQESSANVANLKQENASLLQEARATRSLRDELDILKEKASKVDMFEKEILSYKERLNELEFYKARTEELKEDNSILEETKAMLEDQLEGSRKRIETVVELESEMRKYRQQLEEMNKHRAAEREKLEYLTEENARLEFEKKSSMNESASLESELSAVRSKIGSMGSSLSGQLSETSHACVLRLELENQRLSAQLAEMKESALIHNAEISLEMEKENQRLAKKVEKLQASACESSEQAVRAESELASAREEKSRLAQALDAFKDNAERQVRGLEKENEQLSQALDNIRDRCEKTSDARVKDLERENKRLHEAVTSKNSELSKLEFECRQFQRSVHQLDDNRQRLQELTQENQGLEKENSELHQKVTTLQHMAERVEAVEQESSDLSCENRKLQRTVESLQTAQTRREQLEQDHISLQVEHQRLQRTIESLKGEAERAVELETEKDELNQQLQQLRKSLEGQKTHKLKQEQMEFELIDTTNEKQRLQKSMEVTTRRLHQLEKDNMDIETENDRLTKEMDALRVAVKRLEERDREAGVLDGEVVKLHKDKTALEKENRKLKQSSELKESALEELNAKFQALDKESKSLRRSVDKMKATCGRVKELEHSNSELLQELNTDRRTLATLREDLVNEKIRSQELSNELEQLNSELEKVGINTHKLTIAEQTNDANRYKALETMIEDTLKKSSELKDEKIEALEARLEQSKSRNLKLQEDLRVAHRESEGLKQRVEEVEGEKAPVRDAVDGRERFVRTGSSNATKELFQLKDHLVELERSNARLLTETDNLKSNNSILTDQCRRLETQVSNLQTQNASMHGHFSSLKEQDAKLQVEYSTLQSQLSSQMAQQESLKSQLSRKEMEHEQLSQKHEGLQATHTSLVSDHESLQHLHEQLTCEYEALVSEHGALKSMHKSLKGEMKDAQEQMETMLRDKDDVNKLRSSLDQERERLKRELASLGPLQAEHTRLRDDHQQIRAAYDKLSLDYTQVLNNHKQVKTEYNNMQLKATNLQGELNEAKENMSVADVEFQKLENKIETVYQINERIENENQALLLQIKQLLNQNHDLLTQALNSKDHFAEEEKAYLEKLSDLRRQKERLEEKIMEHYKNRISPKKKGLGALIARKARGIISRGPRRSKSRNNLNEGLDSLAGSSVDISDSSRRLDDVSSLLSLQSAIILGAKSTENVNEAAGGDSLLPGVGRPYLLDGEEVQGRRSTTPGVGRRTPGRSSPGSEMLTLDQFLKEANKSPRNNENEARRRTSHDSESKGSDNSNNSNSWRRSGSGLHPELATSNTSLLSPAGLRTPGGNGANDNSSLSSGGGPGGPEVFTSTPKTEADREGLSSSSSVIQHSTPNSDGGGYGSRYLNHKRLSGGDDWRSSSQESSPYASTSRMNLYAPPPASSSSPRDPASPSTSTFTPNSHTPLSSQLQQQHYQAGNLNVNNNNNHNLSRAHSMSITHDLPPVPKDPPPPLPAADRLDRLTMLASAPPQPSRDQHPTPPSTSSLNHHNWPPPPSANKNGPAPHDDVVLRRPDLDPARRSSQGERHVLPDQFQSPVPRSQPPVLATPLSSRRGEDSTVMSGHNPRRPAGNLMPGQNHPLNRARPASAMGPSPHVRGVISRPPGEGRPRLNQHQQGRELSATESTARAQYSQAPNSGGGGGVNQRQPDRPKSVPPHMFNKSASGEDGGHHPSVPPRRMWEEHDAPHRETPRNGRTSSISLLREPSRSASRGPTSPSDPTHPGPAHNNSINSNSSGGSNQQQQQQQQQQHNFGSHNGDVTRQNSGWRPPSQPFSDHQNPHQPQQQYQHHQQQYHHHQQQHQQHQQQQHQQQRQQQHQQQRQPPPPSHPGPYAGSSAYTRQQTRPGQSGPRPDSLTLGGGQPPPPRSQSSMGHPVGQAGPFSPTGLQGRSMTPGPHPAVRRESGHLREGQGAEFGARPQHQAPEPGHRQPPPGQGYQRPPGQGYTPQTRHDSGSESEPGRQSRPGLQNSGVVYGSNGSSRPGERGYPHPTPRAQPYSHQQPQRSGGIEPSYSTSNGPHSSYPSQDVPPQIRSQGRPPGGSSQPPPPPAPTSHRQVGSSPLPPPPVAEGSTNSPEVREEDKGQAKPTSSIWYEYGCV